MLRAVIIDFILRRNTPLLKSIVTIPFAKSIHSIKDEFCLKSLLIRRHKGISESCILVGISEVISQYFGRFVSVSVQQIFIGIIISSVVIISKGNNIFQPKIVLSTRMRKVGCCI